MTGSQSARKSLAFIYFAFLITLGACKSEQTLVPAAPTATPAPLATPPQSTGTQSNATASINAGAYLKIEMTWEFQDQNLPKIDVGTCMVPANSTPGTSQSCVFAIPEAQMFYSKFHFTAGTSDKVQCKELQFYPYFYYGSTDAAFYPAWFNLIPETPVKCDGSEKFTSACFNGPATKLITDFPNKSNLVVLTKNAVEMVATIDSTWSLDQWSNRFMANTKSNWTTDYVRGPFGSPPVSFPEYVGSASGVPGSYPFWTYSGTPITHQDYRVECRDEWNELIYSVTVVLADVDTPSGQTPGTYQDHFPTWP